MKEPIVFADRREAGEMLAELLKESGADARSVLLALPRGGVPVAAAIAAKTGMDLDILVVRKLGLPEQPEVAMGAIASGGAVVLDDWIYQALSHPDMVVERVMNTERAELERREKLYRADLPPVPVEGRTVILVDDGLATGATMRAAVAAVRKWNAGRIQVAVPVASREALAGLQAVADKVFCLSAPEDFGGVERFYDDFSQTTDDEVRRLLAEPLARMK